MKPKVQWRSQDVGNFQASETSKQIQEKWAKQTQERDQGLQTLQCNRGGPPIPLEFMPCHKLPWVWNRTPMGFDVCV